MNDEKNNNNFFAQEELYKQKEKRLRARCKP